MVCFEIKSCKWGEATGKFLLKLFSYKELKIAWWWWLIKQKEKPGVLTYIYSKIMVEIAHIVVFEMCIYTFAQVYT